MAARECLSVAGDLGDIETLAWILTLISAVVSDKGDAEAGAILVGATRATCERHQLVLTGAELDLLTDTERSLLQVLDRDGYGAALLQGDAMSLEQAIGFALGRLEV